MKVLHTAAAWLVAILVPFALIMLGVRLLLTPLYLQIEYRLPGFPPDEYGFTTEERIHWGGYGITYLLNGAPPSYLSELQFQGGEPVFTGREVRHMQDVQQVVMELLRWWYVTLGLLALLWAWAWRAGWLAIYRAGLRSGGILTLALAGISGALGTVGALGSGDLFWEFFSGFHGLFFSGNSWLFEYSDSLIRLYPIRFWQDSVLYIGVLAALAAVILILGLRDKPGRSSVAASSSAPASDAREDA